MKRFLIKTMGCKSNQLEGALIEENLLQNGYIKAVKIEDTDFFVLNSCTVTHKSDHEAFQILRKAKKDNQKVKTILTGCIAQIEKDELLKNPDIDFVAGNDEKLNLSDFINSNSKIAVKDILKQDTFNKILLNDTGKTRASLKIQDGCDNRCSYCIIPFARGKSRSAEIGFILEQIKKYEDADFKEIMLTGIHIGQWGIDLKEKKKLLHLLESIEEKTNIQRFRLGSLNPLEIDDEMLNFLKSSDKFCPHFHLSLQSMCDKTLKSMNRFYSADCALDLIEKIKEAFILPFIGSDIIAGFAGESEEDFLKTISNLEKSKLTQIHTFPYSVRKNTIAEKLEFHNDSKTKEKRASIIKSISAEKYKSFLSENVGSIQEIIIEKNPDKKTGLLKGMSRNYLNILISDSQELGNLRNTIQKVKITEIESQIFASLI